MVFLTSFSSSSTSDEGACANLLIKGLFSASYKCEQNYDCDVKSTQPSWIILCPRFPVYWSPLLTVHFLKKM